MDNITHAVIGICEGELIAGKQLGKKAMLYGAIANNIPDIDVFSRLWIHMPGSLLAHRGFTHSILFALIFSPVLAYVFRKIYKNKQASYLRWLVIFGSGIFTHIFIDAFTTYGTGWFEPFNHVRVSFNTLFIIDPLFSIPVLIGAVVLLVLRKDSAKRIPWAKWTLIISSAYFIFAAVNKLYIDHVVEKSLSAQHIRYDNYMAAPTPLNNILWYIVARNDSDYYVGYYSLFDANSYISYQKIPRNNSLVSGLKDTTKLQKLTRFSDGYYTISKQDSTIIFSDMRFGQDGGWYKKDAPFAFNFVLQQGTTTTPTVRARFRSANKEGIRKLLARIKGIDQTKESN
jgi:inner membrane protein